MHTRRMRFRVLTTLWLVVAGGFSEAAEDGGVQPADLSPESRELLRSEMREITRGMEELVSAVAEARWETIEDTATQISNSFVLQQELTEAQRQELARLPRDFQALDRAFHAQAQELARAAKQHDIQAVTSQYHLLLSSCASCHAEFARAAFPGFTPREPAPR